MRATVLAALALATSAPAAASQHHGPAPPRADPEAPAGAPPHWISSEAWVLNHWLPYDERRLLALLRTDRTGLWRQLRDDRRTVWHLARRRGWSSPGRLARALVAGRGDVHPGRRAVLVRRAERTLTQGHMAQHILFHTLHQEVLPQRARALFGPAPARFRALRRLDLSPFEIARAAGRERAAVEAGAARVLRRTAARGVVSGAVSARQARTLLDRQLRQLPRWLDHRRYNGPPPTDDATGKPEAPLLAHALAPSLSADGRHVAFEQAQPSVPLAVAEGEIAVQVRAADGAARSGPAPARGACSAYSAALAAGGDAVAMETAAGNETFGKRYGQLAVALADLRSGRTRTVSPAGWTAYEPSIAADGRVVAFQAVRATGPRARVAVWRTGRTTLVPGDARQPALSGDGRAVAFTRLLGGRAVVVVRDLRTGGERRLGPGTEPALDHTGRVVAFTRGRRVLVHRTGRTRPLSPSRHAQHSPAVAPDGSAVAFAQRRPGTAPSGRPRQDVVLAVRSGRSVVVSRGTDGRRLAGYAAHPSLARGAAAVAFTADGPGGVQRVFVRDLRGGTTRQVSTAPGRAHAVPIRCASRPPAW